MDGAISSIGTAAKELHTRQTILRRDRNTLLPIASLPPELLSRILVMAATRVRKVHFLPRGGAEWLPELPDPALAIQLSHVSSGVREVALATTALWAAPWRPEDAMGETMFARSQQALLSIVWPLHDTVDPVLRLNRMRFLKMHVARAQHLCTAVLNLENDAERLWGPTPFLETLITTSAEPAAGAAAVIRLPTYAPRLRTLVLRTHGVPFLSPILTNLTRLGLDIRERNTAEDILHTLNTVEKALNLCELKVLMKTRHVSWAGTAIPPAKLRSDLARMPRLRKISFIGDFICAFCLLQHLQLESATQLTVEGTVAEATDREELDMLIHFVNNYTAQDGNAPTRLDFVEDEETEMLRIRLWNGSSSSPVITLGITRFLLSHLIFERMLDFVDAVKWNALRDLRFDLAYELMLEVLLDAFSASDRVQTISFTHDTDQMLPIFLRAMLPKDPDVVPFSGLQEIVFMDVDFAAEGFVMEDQPGSELPLNGLLRTLDGRSSQGTPLASLTLCNCKLESSVSTAETALSAVRALVKDVRVLDGAVEAE
jgi:hypothetical protein